RCRRPTFFGPEDCRFQLSSGRTLVSEPKGRSGRSGAVIPDQFVDPQVSRAKFDRELTEYRQLEADYRRRGWLLVRAEFPSVHVVLATPQLTPPAIVTGVAFDYTNYDMRPPSVRLVDPFTAETYKAKELPTHLKTS